MENKLLASVNRRQSWILVFNWRIMTLDNRKKAIKSMLEVEAKRTQGIWSTKYGAESILHGPCEKWPKGGYISGQTEGDCFIFDEDANFVCVAANNFRQTLENELMLIDKIECLIHRAEKSGSEFSDWDEMVELKSALSKIGGVNE